MPDDLVIRGGRVVDQSGERVADVLVRGGRVVEVGSGLSGEETLDASGCIVAPGLVDLHVHLREPGMEEAETVETGARAAALGGFTAVVAMPNTEPALDDPAIVASVLAAGDARARARCCRRGASPRGEPARRWRRWVSCTTSACGSSPTTAPASPTPGSCATRSSTRWPSRARSSPNTPRTSALAGNGSMHEGAWSSRLGIPGRPAAAEDVIVARDLILAELTGARLHFLHVSTAGAVELVRAAKARGLAVTAEAAPHHFTLTDECCAGFDPVFKVHPPLRTDADVEAIKRGLADGTIDAIATDHAPHPVGAEGAAVRGGARRDARARDRARARAHGAGRTGRAVARRRAGAALVASRRHRRLVGPRAAGSRPDAVANLCVIDPAVSWEVDPLRLASKSRNTPFAGRKLTGRVRHTLLRGEPVVVDGEAQR